MYVINYCYFFNLHDDNPKVYSSQERLCGVKKYLGSDCIR